MFLLLMIQSLAEQSLAQHTIDTGDHPPIKQQPRRTPFIQRENDMQERGVVQCMGKSHCYCAEERWYISILCGLSESQC